MFEIEALMYQVTVKNFLNGIGWRNRSHVFRFQKASKLGIGEPYRFIMCSR